MTVYFECPHCDAPDLEVTIHIGAEGEWGVDVGQVCYSCREHIATETIEKLITEEVHKRMMEPPEHPDV